MSLHILESKNPSLTTTTNGNYSCNHSYFTNYNTRQGNLIVMVVAYILWFYFLCSQYVQAKEENCFKSTIALMRDGRFLGDTFNLESTHTHSGVAVTVTMHWGTGREVLQGQSNMHI